MLKIDDAFMYNMFAERTRNLCGSQSVYTQKIFFLKDALLDEGTLARDDGLLCYINRNKYNYKVHRRPGT